jgi:hypothetical protein
MPLRKTEASAYSKRFGDNVAGFATAEIIDTGTADGARGRRPALHPGH